MRFLVRRLFFLVILFSLAVVGYSQTVQQNMWVTDGPVSAIARDNTTIYLGGSFSYVGPPLAHSVAINASSGAVVTGFPSANGPVFAAVSDGAGGWYIGGEFSAVGGVARNRLARVLADNSVAPWNPGADSTVEALAYDGTIVYVGGSFSLLSGQSRSFLGAVNGSTGAATAWAPNPNGPVYALELVGTAVYVGGSFSVVGSLPRSNVAAVTSAGVVTTFNPIATGAVHAILNGSGVIYLGGEFDALLGGQIPRLRLAAVDPTSGGATPWDPSADGDVFALALSGSTVYIGGAFLNVGSQQRQGLAAVDASGALTFWNPGANAAVLTMTVAGTSVFVGGNFTTMAGQSRRYLAAISVSTGAPTAWNPIASRAVRELRNAGGNVFAGGDFGSVGGVIRGNIAALDATTGAATTWNPLAYGQVEALLLEGSTLYTGGSFLFIGGQQRNRIAALSTATGQATTWNPGADGEVQALALSGTTLYAGGRFTQFGGQTRNRIAAVSTSTGTVAGWNPNADNSVLDIEVAGTTIYASGFFTTIGGQPRNNIAAIGAATGTATAWNPDAGGPVHDMAINGSIMYAGGEFLTIGGQPRNFLAALNLATGVATAWNPSLDAGVFAVSAAGPLVFAGGIFQTVGPLLRRSFASILASNGSATPWNPLLSGGSNDLPQVRAVLPYESTVHVGGDFTQALNASRHFLMSFTDPALAPSFGISPGVVNLGNVPVGSSAVGTVVITNAGASTLQITQVSSTNPEFAVAPASATIPPGTSRGFAVIFTPASAGPETARIRFTHNAPSALDSITANGTGTAAASFSVSPVSFDFGGVSVDSSRTDSVTVTNGGGEVLTVSSVTSSAPGFSVTPSSTSVPPSGSTKFFITFQPTSGGSQSGSIRFVHSAPGSPDSVAVSGTGLVSGLSFTVQNLFFDDIEVGTGENQSFDVRNTGGAPLRIDSLRIMAPQQTDFSIVGSSGPLPPIPSAGLTTLTLRFTPQVEGSQSAMLVVYSNAPTSPDSLFVSGFAIRPFVQVTVAGDTLVSGTADLTVVPPPGFQPTDVSLFFRKGGEAVYDSVTMTAQGANFVGSLPSSVLTIRGVEYYIRILHAQGTITFPSVDPTNIPAILRIRFTSVTAPITLPRRKYSMVSVPAELSEQGVASIFEDDYGPYAPNLWRVFKRENEIDVEHPAIASPVLPGAGFWLITHSGQGFDADNGRSVSSATPAAITVQPGWNQIANPFAFPVAWTSVTRGGRVQGIHRFDGVQFQLDTAGVLRPWEAYYVFNEESFAATLTFPPQETPGPAPLPTAATAYELRIQLRSPDGASDIHNVIGLHSQALVGRDGLDFFKPPHIGEFVSASIMEDGKSFARNFKPIEGEGQHWDVLLDASVGMQEIDLTIIEEGHVPQGYGVYVFDLSEGRTLGNSGGTWRLNLAETRRLRIAIGTPDYALSHSDGLPLAPVAYVLEQNYPNPFNPSTTITYQLSKQGQTLLQVYDVLGQHVRTLVDDFQTSGTYRVEWDGKDGNGAMLSSGVYFIRLQSDGFVGMKKTLFLR
ncbi:MAG: choice-of-anchor D domain-containing protein [Bacteroidota bacterium]